MNYKVISEIILQSIKDSFASNVWKYLTGGNIGVLFTVFLFGKNFLGETVSNSIKIGAYGLLGIFIVRFSLFGCQNSFQFIHKKFRESRYGDAIVFLKDAFAKVNHLKRKGHDDEELITTLKYLCDKIKEIFDKKNLCDCSVSIKVPVKGTVSEKTSIKNLCRDTHSVIRDNPNYEAVNHTIIGNTAFQKVLNNVLRKKEDLFYLNNDITNSRDYENTSKELYENQILPYNSEIVVPIIPSHTKEFDIMGFLCVDCALSNKFDIKYDPALIEGVADGIYDILFSRNSNIRVQNET